jgi:UDP-glucose 4-epimerase
MRAMRLLVTGGAGCLGSNLIEYYISQQHEICVIDNFVTGKREAIPKHEGIIVVEGSVADDYLVNQTFAAFKPTHVVHSAAAYLDPNDWNGHATVNVLGTINVAKAAMECGVDRFVNFQTALCYGRPSQVPIPIDHPLAPFTSYGISKTAGEAYLLLSPLPLVSLRLANVCGPRLAIGPIPTFYKRLRAGQSCICSETTRDFLDISDFIALMDRVLDVTAPNGVFNVSTGEGHTMLEVLHEVAACLGILAPLGTQMIPPNPDDVAQVILDPSDTEKKLGWRAKVGFHETIFNQVRWYDAHGVSDIFGHLSVPLTRNNETRSS